MWSSSANSTNVERSGVICYLRGVIVALEQLNVILGTVKQAVAVQQSCFCLPQTLTDVLLLSAQTCNLPLVLTCGLQKEVQGH